MDPFNFGPFNFGTSYTILVHPSQCFLCLVFSLSAPLLLLKQIMSLISEQPQDVGRSNIIF